jgi:carbon-monoxide dehydrogenase catalytic subunit
MEFIQKKTADKAVVPYLPKAADEGISLMWDRFEGQLPECGFCESGLSCRDCLQGPCISHPFQESNKVGVCGKDKDILAVHSLLRMVVKGTFALLDQADDFAKGLGKAAPKDGAAAEAVAADIKAIFGGDADAVLKAFPQALVESWAALGIKPEGVASDLVKAAQKLEGGIGDVEDNLLWALKASLLGCMAQQLYGRLKKAVYGAAVPQTVEVNLGNIRMDVPNILLCGPISPILKEKIAARAAEKNIAVSGLCTDPLVGAHTFAPVTSYGSQEIPMMTGAIDLIVAADQSVNPSLAKIAKKYNVAAVSTESIGRTRDLDAFADEIVKRAAHVYELREAIERDVPNFRESAVIGYSPESIDVKKIFGALKNGGIKGVALLGGSNNAKYTQDDQIVTMAKELLAKDVLCISEGEASIVLAKHGLLNPKKEEKSCGKGVAELLSALGSGLPEVLDFGITGIADFIAAASAAEEKPLSNYPIFACFPEANRAMDVSKALGAVAFGVTSYLWPYIPVTGSVKTVKALTDFCKEKVGGKCHVIVDKIDAKAKAWRILRDLEGAGAQVERKWQQAPGSNIK